MQLQQNIYIIPKLEKAHFMANEDTMDLGIGMSDMMPMMMIMMMAIMMSMIQSQQTTSQSTAQALQVQSYEGKTIVKELNATATLSWVDLVHTYPNIPWSWAFFVNDGPYDVQIGINNPGELFIIHSQANRVVDRRGASERISVIFYVCEPTETATVSVTGEY